MDVTAYVALPTKTAGAGTALRNFLVGAKHIPLPELLKMRRLVADSGWAYSAPSKGMLGSIRGAFLGSSADPLGVLKARYRQGGVLGRGGLVRGDMAFDPVLAQSWRKLRGGEHTAKNYWDLVSTGASGSANVAFGAGLPVAAGVAALTGNGSPGDVGAETSSLLGYTMGAPFGILGSLALGTAGSVLGDKVFRGGEDPPPGRALAHTARSAVQGAVNTANLARNQLAYFTPPEPEINLSGGGYPPMIQSF